ncbi:branched-chain amino acid ABC transporter permease [Alicyclobacillus sp.]|uniref:branched-chain amino acid ABC transporter permease n=1 Tax=Alicyclobacillus sp. TaxID=61169 RepID=UPI0025C5E4B6|nr:branched-chain amino acid ABC transporter permease [Alicyclobacillus sp.]MCL6517530.1 branched-chain amino acid ABC transporter permease [Alicyclobacillus sp.]
MNRIRSWILPVLALIVFAVIPFTASFYYQQIFFYIFLFAGVGFAWNLVGGYAGQLSLGHAAFFGIGAYTYALLAQHIGVWPALLAAAVLSTVSAAPIGLICFRLRGPYFALATIAVAQLLLVLATNQFKDLTQGAAGLLVQGMVSDPSLYYWVALGFMILAFAITALLATSKTGYYLMAIREDEDTAQTVTINTPLYKLYALLVSALLTGVGGAIFAANLGTIQPNDVFSGAISNQVVFLSILGGTGTLFGPLVGAVILEFASDWLKNALTGVAWLGDPNAFAFFLYGLLIVLVVMFMPAGIVGTLTKWWKGRVARVQSQRTTAAGV